MTDSYSEHGILNDPFNGWTYDPGWTWPGVSLAVHDDGYPVAPEPDYDTSQGYIIEVNDEKTEARLLQNDEADRHERIATISITTQDVEDVIEQLAVVARLTRRSNHAK